MKNGSKLEVMIRIFGHLRSYLQGKHRVTVTVREGTSLKELLQNLGLPTEELWLVHLNGKPADLTAVLKPEDEIDIFAPMGGG